MTAADLISDLKRRGVELRVTGDRLRWRAPRGAMTPELAESLRRCKSETIALLSAPVYKPRRPALSPVPLTEVYPVAKGDEWLADEFYQLRHRAHQP